MGAQTKEQLIDILARVGACIDSQMSLNEDEKTWSFVDVFLTLPSLEDLRDLATLADKMANEIEDGEYHPKFNEDTDEFRDVPGYPGYQVNRVGKIVSLAKSKPMKIEAKESGHLFVQVRVNGRNKKLYVHKAVLLAFVGPRPPKQLCRHLDGDPTNNHVSNLKWGTRLENAADMVRHGTRIRGEMSGRAKLTRQQVVYIRRLVKDGANMRALARKYNVSHTCIRRAALGMSWSHVNSEVRRG